MDSTSADAAAPQPERQADPLAVVKEVFPGRMLRFEPATDPDEALAGAEDEPDAFEDLDAVEP